jgi:ADP-ribose pyrophosphatase
VTSWRVNSREVVFEVAPYVRVVREVVEVAPGKVIDDFYQVELRSFALVVPVLADGRILTLTGYRHGPRRSCLTLPGGFIDPGESPEQAARRELVEETGLIAGSLTALGNFVDNGNQRGCRGHYFLAQECSAGPGFKADQTESFVLAAMTPSDLDAALDRGDFGIIHHVAGWLLARRHLAL